jgi:hypothetical protein
MSERRDNTPEPADAPTRRRAPPEDATGSYYYDDGTGYEIYNPDADKEEEDTTDDDAFAT